MNRPEMSSLGSRGNDRQRKHGLGGGALNDTTGNDNTALGFQAGILATTGDGNVYIGAGMSGVAGESNHPISAILTPPQ